MPDSAYVAAIVLTDPPVSLSTSELATLGVVVTNDSPVEWRHDIPAGRHLCVANHWRRQDGTMAMFDDARARLPRTIGPGESFEVRLRVQAPGEPGAYLLEVDLVQELVCWFAEKGSSTARAAVKISAHGAGEPDAPAATVGATPGNPTPNRRPFSIVDRILRPFRSGTPRFEMHTVPRPQVEETIRRAGGHLIQAIDDNAAGPGWLQLYLRLQAVAVYKRGFTCHSGSLKSVAQSSTGIDRLAYLQDSTNRALSSCQSARVTSHSNTFPEPIVSWREVPGFGMLGTWMSLVNLTEPLSIG